MSSIATRSEIYNLGPVIIKERVTIAQYAYICNGSHDLSDNKLPLVVLGVVTLVLALRVAELSVVVW